MLSNVMLGYTFIISREVNYIWFELLDTIMQCARDYFLQQNLLFDLLLPLLPLHPRRISSGQGWFQR